MPGDDMIERVARAIQTHIHPPLKGKEAQDCYLLVARAAIAAMRNPTTQMVRTLFFGLSDHDIVGGRMPDAVRALFVSVIDTALAPKGSDDA